MNETVTAPRIYKLPGHAVFPESIGIDPATGRAYTGSLADGTLYVIDSQEEATVFSPAGAEGRSSVAGVKIDARGRLWAAGGYERTLDVCDLNDGSMLRRLDVGSRPSCVNDIAFGPDGTAYVTDSFIPRLFRVDGDSLELDAWVDLDQQNVPWPDGLNFNGIVLTPDGRSLVACQTNLGRFWRVSLETGHVDEVDVDGGPLEHCDGLAISGTTLIVAVNARNELHTLELASDGSSARASSILTSDAFAFPTAIAFREEELLVVNAQLDKMGTNPTLPFTVVAIDVPGKP